MTKDSGMELVDGVLTPVWRKNPPTVPGLYWFQLRTSDKPDGVTRFCRVVLHKGHLIVGSKNYDADDFNRVDRLQRWWAGPLPEPVKG